MKKIKAIFILAVFLGCLFIPTVTATEENEKQTKIFNTFEGWWKYDSPECYKINGISIGRIFLAIAHVDGEDRLVIGFFNDGNFNGYMNYDSDFERVYGDYTIDGDEFRGTWYWRRGYGEVFGTIN